MSSVYEPGDEYDADHFNASGFAPSLERSYPVVDTRCTCSKCVEPRWYMLAATCGNCREGFRVKVRHGDKPGRPDCPMCGVGAANLGGLIETGSE